jgi:ABC-type multidrug transport system ATPase subunit
MDEAEYICQRLVFLRQGRVVAEGTAADLRVQSGRDSLTAAFLHFALGSDSSAPRPVGVTA